MQAKRVLILTNRVPYPLNDGGNLATHAMIKGYKQQGWQVRLLSMNTSRHYTDAATVAKAYADLAEVDTVSVVTDVTIFGVLKNLLFSKEPNHADRFTDSAFADALIEAVQSFQPDVVQVESVFLSGYLPLLKENGHALTVLRLHNIEWQVWKRVAANTRNPIKKGYLRHLSARIKQYEERVWQQYDLLLPITDADAVVVAHTVGKQQMLTIPFSIDIKPDAAPANAQEAGWVAYHLGAMDWLPNQDAMQWLAQDIWPMVQKENPGFEFFFAGRNMPASFQSLASAHFHCVGEVPDADSFIADKKILLVPLRSGGGIRVKILEAMAAGKIIISTQTGMQGIDAQHGKHYLLANTPQAFADSIKQVLQNKEEALQMAENARKLVNTLYNASHWAAVLSEKLSQLHEKDNAL